MSKRTEKEKNLIVEILYWAKIIKDAGYGHIKWSCPQINEQKAST